MAIAPDGNVVPCQSWLNNDANLGNMLKDTWKSIWNNPKCIKIRRNSSKELKKCPLRGDAI